MRIKFWGVRGSIPCPGPETMHYGGNTACIELHIEPLDRRIIIDAGSGIRALGNDMVAHPNGKKQMAAELFITHTHWDHILGFPFFTPLYLSNYKLNIYGPVTHEDATLEQVLGGQLTYRYFPIRHEELSATIIYHDLKEGEYDLGQGVKLITQYLNHPLLCMGYRFEFDQKVVCTVYDTEPFSNLFELDPEDSRYDPEMAAEGGLVAAEQNRRIEDFIQCADLLIYDAQYTRAEYDANKKGWGHSPIEHAIEIANRNQVKHLALFHHDVQRTDAQLEDFKHIYCKSPHEGRTHVFFAQEGAFIDL